MTRKSRNRRQAPPAEAGNAAGDTRGAERRDSEESSAPDRWAPISTLAEDAHAHTVASVRGSSSRLDAVTRRLMADLYEGSATAIRAALERIMDARKQ